MLSRLLRTLNTSRSSFRLARLASQSATKSTTEEKLVGELGDFELRLSPKELTKYNIYFNTYKAANMLFVGVQLWFGFSLFSSADEHAAIQSMGILCALDNVCFGAIMPFWNNTISKATNPIEEGRMSEFSLRITPLIAPLIAPALMYFNLAPSYTWVCALFLAKYFH